MWAVPSAIPAARYDATRNPVIVSQRQHHNPTYVEPIIYIESETVLWGCFMRTDYTYVCMHVTLAKGTVTTTTIMPEPRTFGIPDTNGDGNSGKKGGKGAKGGPKGGMGRLLSIMSAICPCSVPCQW